jgi:hypothetical protein
MIQDKIYQYFERDPELKVLFIFNNEFLAMELQEVEWRTGYRYVDFKGDWFTVKYKLDNEWQNDKVILLFHQPSPLEVKSLQASFPLMDVLAANMEYHSQDYAPSFSRLDYLTLTSMVRFVEETSCNCNQTRCRNCLVLYQDAVSLRHDGSWFPHSLGHQRIMDWDSIIVRLLFYGRKSESQKQLDFYVKLRTCKDVTDALNQHLIEIFGVTFNDNTEGKVADIVKVMKYNAIVQNLTPVDADNYKQSRVTDSYALQHINRILELALSQEKSAKAIMELFNELGADIRDADIIRWYGTGANYYFVSEGLCLPIIRTLLEKDIETEPAAVINRIEELMVKHSENGALSRMMDYAILVARFYETALGLGSLTLNTADEYVHRYQTDYYLTDQYYRQATELYFKIDPTSELFDSIQKVKLSLDQNYSKLCNRINLEWTRCLKETGGMDSVHLLRQDDFYDEKIKPIQKKVAVIVSDALRYEIAQELIGELAKSRHIASLKPALAMLPTETKYCKPALLPHHELKLYGQGDEQDMAVDNRILSDTTKRCEHLQKYRDGAICVNFETVAEYNQDKNREIFKHSGLYLP